MSDELSCRVCGIAIEYAGTGRKPVYCVDHRETRNDKKPVSRQTKNARKTTAKTSFALKSELLDTFNGLGAMVLMVDRYDGAVIINGAPRLTDALVSMAEHNPQFRKWLETSTGSVVWIQLATAVAAIAVPIAAHHKLLPVDEVAAYQLFYGKPQATQPKPEPAPAPAEVTEPEPVPEVA